MLPGLDFPCELVVDAWDLWKSARVIHRLTMADERCSYITGTSRIPILKPSSTDVVILFVHGDIQVLHSLFGFLEEIDGRCAGSHEDYSQFPFGAKGLLTDSVAGSIDFCNMQAVTFCDV